MTEAGESTKGAKQAAWTQAAERELAALSTESRQTGAFRPAFESETRLLCRVAAHEGGRREWHKRHQQHTQLVNQRLVAKVADSYKASQKLLEESARLSSSLGITSRQNLAEAYGKERAQEKALRSQRTQAGLQLRTMVSHREQLREVLDGREQVQQDMNRTNLIRMASACKDIAEATQQQVDEITRQSREARRKPLSAPHTPRVVLTRRLLGELTAGSKLPGSPHGTHRQDRTPVSARDRGGTPGTPNTNAHHSSSTVKRHG